MAQHKNLKIDGLKKKQQKTSITSPTALDD